MTLILRLSAIFICVYAAAQIGLCRTVADADGRTFEFSKPPSAATVVPNISQEIFAIGAQNFLLGNSNYCIFPEAAKTKPKLGGLLNPDYEKIALLKPDIFILPLSPTGKVIARRLESVGVKPFFTYPEGIENVAKDILLLGKVFFKDETARQIATSFEAEVASESARKAGRGRRAIFVFGNMASGNMAAGKGSFVGGLMKACGLVNCADKTGSPWPILSREFIVNSAPEIIFAEIGAESDIKKITAAMKSDPAWASTPAVKNLKICFIHRDIATIPSPRILEALRIMRAFCEAN